MLFCMRSTIPANDLIDISEAASPMSPKADQNLSSYFSLASCSVIEPPIRLPVWTCLIVVVAPVLMRIVYLAYADVLLVVNAVAQSTVAAIAGLSFSRILPFPAEGALPGISFRRGRLARLPFGRPCFSCTPRDHSLPPSP